jgi:penicillin-insensitive murein endopeptidase
MSVGTQGFTRALALGLLVALAPSPALAKSHAAHNARKGAQSVGAPNNGHLSGAIRLRGSKTLRQREGSHSWGLPQLVHMLRHAASAVARKHARSQMLVGDLSGRTGGHLDGHGSHQTGRDADVGFYVTNSKGKPMAVKRFIPFDAAGNARDVQGVHFDEARNWAMIEAMLKDEKAGVRYMFISNALRSKLLAYAARKHVSKELVERASTVMISPNDADLHDDHIHVRIGCPDSMHDVCIEEATARESVAKGTDDDKPAEPGAKQDGVGTGDSAAVADPSAGDRAAAPP